MRETIPYNRYEVRQLIGRGGEGERGRGTRYHAVQGWDAVCGVSPGRMSAGWSYQTGESVTCPRCLKRIIDRDLLPLEPVSPSGATHE